MFECEVEKCEPGVKVASRHPTIHRSSDLLLASCYVRTKLALPTITWSISIVGALFEESLVATLGPLEFTRAAVIDTGKHRLAIKGKPAEPAHLVSISDTEGSETIHGSYGPDHHGSDAEVTESALALATPAGDDAAAPLEAASPGVPGAVQSIWAMAS